MCADIVAYSPACYAHIFHVAPLERRMPHKSLMILSGAVSEPVERTIDRKPLTLGPFAGSLWAVSRLQKEVVEQAFAAS